MMKLINNFVCGAQAASFAEGLATVHAAGLDQAKAVRILTEGAPGERDREKNCNPTKRRRWRSKFYGPIDGQGPRIRRAGSVREGNSAANGRVGAGNIQKSG